MAKILIINGSIHGEARNCGFLIEVLGREFLKRGVEMRILSLHEYFEGVPQEAVALGHPLLQFAEQLKWADGFAFLTGTYWDSWGSPLQRFFEITTPLEGSETWMGKPAMSLVTMHSVGGKEVLSRLQGVLSTLGVIIPPMSGIVLSALAAQTGATPESQDLDVWSLADIPIAVTNLLKMQALVQAAHFEAWPRETQDFEKVWLKS